MKIRQGFVSNSSSTSFCIIGVTDPRLTHALLKAEGPLKDEGGSAANGKVIEFYGTESDFRENENEYIVTHASMAGVQAEKFLKDRSISEAKKAFVELIKDKFGITAKLGQVGLHYGEVSSG